MGAPVLTPDRTETLPRLPTVLFVLLQGLFGETGVVVVVAAGIATICVVLFFVTSSDSASMVIDIIASGGNPDPPVGTRLFWAITEGVVAAGLLLAGGLLALQAASITAALPFTVILLAAAVSLTVGLHRNERPEMAEAAMEAVAPERAGPRRDGVPAGEPAEPAPKRSEVPAEHAGRAEHAEAPVGAEVEERR